MQPTSFFSLDQVIDAKPLILATETPLLEVIGMMQEKRKSCDLDRDLVQVDKTVQSNHNCVVAISDSQLVGIFTERDLVRLIATGVSWQDLTLGDVMSKKAITLTFSESQDIFSALDLLRHHQIRHLPFLGEQENLLGLISQDSFHHALQFSDQLKSRQATEVMTRAIYALTSTTVLEVARLMAEYGVSCIPIVENIGSSNLFRPLGIITERDIIQFESLRLNSTEILAGEIMSSPLLVAKADDSLQSVQQQIERSRIRQLVVTGLQGELLGVVTQSSLLQAFQIAESRKTAYHQENPLNKQVAELNTRSQREQIVATIALRIRQSLNLKSILQKTVSEIRQLLQSDRALIYRLEPDWTGIVTTESVSDRKWSIVDRVIKDECFEENWTVRYQQGHIHAINDVSQSQLSQCYIEFLDSFHIKANVAIPILLTDDYSPRDRLWGLLIIHQCSAPRVWQESELDLLQLLATQVAIAIQQGELYQQVQNELRLRQESEAATEISQQQLKIKIKQQKAIAKLGQYALQENELQPLIKQIVTVVAAVLKVEYCKVLELLPDEKKLLLKAGVGWHDGLVGVATLEANTNSQAGYTLSTSKPVVVTNLLSETRFTGPDLLLDHQVISGISIAVPHNDGRIFGILGVHTTQQRSFTQDEVDFIQAIANILSQTLDRLHRESVLKDIASGMSVETGENFFPSLVEYLSKTLKLDYAYVGRLIEPEKKHIETLAICHRGKEIDNIKYYLAGTPCEDVFNKKPCVYPEKVQQLFPEDQLLRTISAQSYAGMPIFVKNGQALGLISIIHRQPFKNTFLIEEVLKIFARVVTKELERQQTELALRQSEQKFRAIFNQTFQFIGLLEPDGTLIEANQTSLEFVGMTLAEVVGKPFWETPWWSMSPEIQAQIRQAIERAAQGEFVRFEVQHPGTENRVVTVDFSLTPIKDEAGKVIMLIPEGRNISDRKQAENKIREQAELLDIATDAIIVRSSEDRILFWNHGAEKLYGWTKEETLDRPASELFYRKSKAKLNSIYQKVDAQGKWQGELNHVNKAGDSIVVESRWTLVTDEAGNPQSYLVVNTNITEQKQLQEQFLRTQRLESLGTLAGGIAHDLNNILAPILGFSKLLPLKLPNVDDQTKGFFKIMENNANRGTALVKQILTFSRGLEGEKGIAQVRHLIAEIEQIINETFPKSIELQTNISKNLWTVYADVNQLHQVLMNISVNARDAMTDGGTLTINAANTTIDAEYARLHLNATEGDYVCITVSDTGIGIPPEVIDRIFEPFFTTKEVGRGTGLGLSTVIGIIKSHDGFVEVTSDCRHSKGTKFKVFLPASDVAESNIEEPEEDLQGNGELILVVDDESAVLEVTKATLETYNYQVLTASDGIKAIAAYAQNKENVEMVIMDIMMPAMDGKTAIRTLKQINPDLKIIAVSGLIERQEIVAGLNGDVITFLNKPYSNDDLLKTIHKLLNT